MIFIYTYTHIYIYDYEVKTILFIKYLGNFLGYLENLLSK